MDNREKAIFNLIHCKDSVTNAIENLNRVLCSLALQDGYGEEERDNMRLIAYCITQLEDISINIECLE